MQMPQTVTAMTKRIPKIFRSVLNIGFAGTFSSTKVFILRDEAKAFES